MIHLFKIFQHGLKSSSLPILCATLLTSTLPAQTIDVGNTLRFGVQGHWNIMQHTANFRALPGIANSSPGFADGTGSGFGGALSAEVPLVSSLFLAARAGYSQQSASFQVSEAAVVSVDGTPLPATFQHRIDTRLDNIFLEGLLGYRFPEPFGNLHGLLGVRGSWMLAPTFSQSETLEEASGTAAFAGGSPTRNVRTNEVLPNAQSLQVGIVGGLGLNLPLTAQRNLFLSPEATYAFALTPFVQNLAWQGNALRLAVNFSYSPIANESSALQTNGTQSAGLPLFASATPFNQPIRAIVQAVSVDNEGNERGLIRLKTEEFVSRQMYPLLNYIFFEPQSAVLPARYARLLPEASRTFAEKQFASAYTLDVYYSILNIIGKRLRDNPTANIRLVGCLGEMGFGPNSEENDPNLALRRAETVRQYLQDIWGIAANRMQVEGRGLPEKPSNARNAALGAEENRRVEILSDAWEVMRPVVVSDTLRETDPPSVRFYMSAEADSGVAKWTLRARQGNRILKTISALGKPDSTYFWQLSRERKNVPLTQEPMRYELEVLDNVERETKVENTIAIEQITVQKKRQNKIADKEVDVYRLIGFGFEESRLQGVNLRSFNELIQPNIRAASAVEIIGYTDAQGDAAANLRLSQTRAQTVGLLTASRNVKTRGVGSKIQLYPNTTPEGRFYSRTVEMRVETPVR